jgi:hypothetical protein
MSETQDKIKKKFNKLTKEEKNALLIELGGVPGGAEKPKKVKKVRDPNKPKKAMTPYLFYTQERRSVITAENPDMGPRDVVKQMGSEWRAMGAGEKAPYETKGAAAKARQKIAMDAYKQ